MSTQIPNCQFRTEDFFCSCPLVKVNRINAAICIRCKYSDEPDFAEKHLELLKPKCHQSIKGPSLPRLAKNFFTSMAKNAWNGFKTVSQERYDARLDICEGCQFRSGNRCLHLDCGCYLSEKAALEAEDCPDKEWSKRGV